MPRPKGTTTVERAPDGGRVQMTIVLDYTDKAALQRIAKRKNTTPTELVRTFITWGIEETTSDKR